MYYYRSYKNSFFERYKCKMFSKPCKLIFLDRKLVDIPNLFVSLSSYYQFNWRNDKLEYLKVTLLYVLSTTSGKMCRKMEKLTRTNQWHILLFHIVTLTSPQKFQTNKQDKVEESKRAEDNQMMHFKLLKTDILDISKEFQCLLVQFPI